MASAIPIAAPLAASALPCSTCSSTKAPRLASSPGSGPMPPGSSPAAVIALARLTPPPSRRSRAAAGSTAPVSSRLPRQARPNRPPSSSVNAATTTGRAGTKPRSRSRSIAAKADTTPSGPSKAPPSGTESRWLPVAIAGCGDPGQSHHAHRLPLRSQLVRRPRCTAWSLNHARQAASASVQENRRYPPVG